MKQFSLAVHGGAGTILKSDMSAEKELAYKEALQAALQAGQLLLEGGATALDAVEASVRSLEDSPLFNAGRGSVFNAEGTHELEASFMEGKTLDAGAVCGIKGVKNPVSLARKIMEHSDFVFLSGNGALQFACENGLKLMDDEYFFDQYRYDQWQAVKDSGIAQLDHSLKKEHKFGTVGAVALDNYGNLAAATSTGGLTNKKYGRIGDSPVIGAGTYANNATCAVSCTGFGEFFLRGVAAYDVSCLMEYAGMTLEKATHHLIHRKMIGLGGEGGLIAIDAKGNVSMPFNSEGMYRGSVGRNHELQIDIYK